MSPFAIGILAFVCSFGGALAGIGLRGRLPEHHLDPASRETVNIGIGLIATLTALVLGLVTASAKSSFDALDTAVKHTAADLLSLDRILARYGPETRGTREELRRAVAHRVDLIWPKGAAQRREFHPSGAEARGVELLAARIRQLSFEGVIRVSSDPMTYALAH